MYHVIDDSIKEHIMNYIGEIDENRSLIEQIDEYSIPSVTGQGRYAVKDLKPMGLYD